MIVRPNAATACGRVTRIRADDSGRGQVWDVLVEAAGDVPGMPNYVRSYQGQNISVYVPPGERAQPEENDRVEIRVAYRGDEHGGRFVLTDHAAARP